MTSTFTINDIDGQYSDKIYYQNDSKKNHIAGVKIISLYTVLTEESDSSKIIRINDGKIKELADFRIAQINRTRMFPETIKAWHVHYQQDHIWYLSPFSHLVVGLWDLRKQSCTNQITMKVVMGGGMSQLLYIPRGVAQGSIVLSKKSVDLYVFSNIHFDLDNLDEQRLPWDSLSADFWKPKRD